MRIDTVEKLLARIDGIIQQAEAVFQNYRNDPARCPDPYENHVAAFRWDSLSQLNTAQEIILWKEIRHSLGVVLDGDRGNLNKAIAHLSMLRKWYIQRVLTHPSNNSHSTLESANIVEASVVRVMAQICDSSILSRNNLCGLLSELGVQDLLKAEDC